MTLEEFFNLLSANPTYILGYFLLIPLAALIGTIIGKGEEDEPVWKYFYSILIYLVAIPGIFAITLSAYLFFFERKSVFDTDIFTQILPILSMMATFFLIKRRVQLERIPGFGRISGLAMMVTVAILAMWMMEKTHIVAFTYLPVQYVLAILIGLLVVFRVGWSKMNA